MRQIGRANAAYSRKVSVIRDLADCVVADAVDLEPVSSAKFPANRENNREFCQIDPLAAILKADTRENSEACSEIPCATEQGIISADREIWRRNREISAAKVTIIPGVVDSTHALLTVPATEACDDHRPEPHHRAGA